MTEEIRKEKVLTVGTLIVGLIISLIACMLVQTGVIFFTPGAWYKWYGDLAWNFSGIPSIAFFMIFCVFLAKIIFPAIKIDPRKMGIIYTMVMSSVIFSTGLGYPLYVIAMWAGIVTHPTLAYWKQGGFVPAWVPKESVMTALTIGGQPVPWSEWSLAILVLASWVLISFLLLSSINVIFRKQWIDIERMDFPMAIATVNFIKMATGYDQADQRTRAKRFLIGFILSVIFFSQFWIALLLPWFPNLTATWTAWPWIPWHQGILDVGMAIPSIWDYLPGIGVNILLSPFVFGWAYLIPLDVLATAFVFWIISAIILQWLFVMAGLYPKPVFPGWGSSMASWNFYVAGKMTFFIENGMWWALALMPIILKGNWKYVANTLRSLARGPSKEEKEDEPLTYRQAWILFIISFIAYTAFMVSALGAFAYVTVIMLLIWVIYHLGNVRLRGLGGIPISNVFDTYAGLPFFLAYSIPEFTAIPSTGQVASNQGWFAVEMFNWHCCFTLSSPSYLGQGSLNIENYKVASLLGIRNKEVFAATLIAAIVSIFFALPFALSLLYRYGIAPPGMSTIWAYAYPRASDQLPGWRGTAGEPPTVQPTLVLYTTLGFVFMAIMVYLRMTFAWWPFHPVGVIIGMSYFSGFLGFGGAFGITFVLKWLTLKIGGVKAYEEWGIPIAIGVCVGYAVAMVIWNLVSIGLGLAL
ncbi:MAG: DUF6785 family protein [Candidatus Bathyarchaeia archaeon]